MQRQVNAAGASPAQGGVGTSWQLPGRWAGDHTIEATGTEARLSGRVSERAGRNASEARAGLERSNATRETCLDCQDNLQAGRRPALRVPEGRAAARGHASTASNPSADAELLGFHVRPSRYRLIPRPLFQATASRRQDLVRERLPRCRAVTHVLELVLKSVSIRPDRP